MGSLREGGRERWKEEEKEGVERERENDKRVTANI